ncbi:hypothetical protein [Parabacteroides sp.]
MFKAIAGYFKNKKKQEEPSVPDNASEPAEEASIPDEPDILSFQQEIIEKCKDDKSMSGFIDKLLYSDEIRYSFLSDDIFMGMSKTFDSIYEKLKKSEAEVASLEKENSDLRSALAKKENTIRQYEKENDKLRSEVDEKEKSLTAAWDEKIDAIHQLENEGSRLRSEIKKKDSLISKLENDNTGLKNDYALLLKDALFWKKQNVVMGQQITVLQRENGATPRVGDYRFENGSPGTVQQEMLRRISSLQYQLKKANNKIEDLHSQIDFYDKKKQAIATLESGLKKKCPKQDGLVENGKNTICIYFGDQIYSGSISDVEQALNKAVEDVREQLNRWKVDLMFKEEELKQESQRLSDRKEFLVRVYPNYLWVLKHTDKINEMKKDLEGTLKKLAPAFSLEDYENQKLKEEKFKMQRTELAQQLESHRKEEKDFIREQAKFRNRVTSLRDSQYLLENEIAAIIDKEERLFFVLRAFYKSMPLYDLVLQFLFSFIESPVQKRIAMQYFKGKSIYEISKDEKGKSKEQIENIIEAATKKLYKAVRSIEEQEF